MLTPEHERLVKDVWHRFAPVAADYSRFFYDKLYELDPEVHTLFAATNLDEQRHRLVETLGHLVSEVDQTERFVADLVLLGRRHAGYGVRESDYDSARVALLWTFEQALGPAFTDEAREAWNEMYHAIASVMRRAGSVTTGTHPSASSAPAPPAAGPGTQ